MGFGLNYEAGGGDIVPIVKFDAKAGRMFRVDRVDGQNTPNDITRNFKAVMDMENVEVGFINFNTGSAPDFVMVPLGDPMPQRPSDQHKQGVRIMLKLGKDCGGDVREISTCAKAAMRGLDEVHTAYQAGKQANPGKLPVVVLKDTIPITSGEGARKSTNYQPIFEVVGWVARPVDLEFKPRAKGQQNDIGHANGAARAVPSTGSTRAAPSTGSTRVDPPETTRAEPQRQAEPAMADDDFG